MAEFVEIGPGCWLAVAHIVSVTASIDAQRDTVAEIVTVDGAKHLAESVDADILLEDVKARSAD